MSRPLCAMQCCTRPSIQKMKCPKQRSVLPVPVNFFNPKERKPHSRLALFCLPPEKTYWLLPLLLFWLLLLFVLLLRKAFRAAWSFFSASHAAVAPPPINVPPTRPSLQLQPSHPMPPPSAEFEVIIAQSW